MMGVLLMSVYDWIVRPGARLGVCLVALLALRGEILSEMVDPAIDDPARPFCYFSRPSTVIGVMDGRGGTQVTAEGYLYTGSAELMFFAGRSLQPTYQRIKTLVEGCMPIVQYDLTRDGVRYDFEMFAATLDGKPESPSINFVKVRASNPSDQRIAGEFAVAFRWRGPRRGVHVVTPYGPFASYWMAPDAAGRGHQLIYIIQGPPPTARALTIDELPAGRPVPFTAQGKDAKILQDTPVCFTCYHLDLQPGQSTELVVKMPYTSLADSERDLRRAIAAADYAAYRQKTVEFWHGIFGRMMRIDLDEPKVVESYKASVMYALVARDKIGNDYVQKVNELQYDDFFLRDCSYIARGYDLVGLNDIAKQTIEHFLKYQTPDGNFESQAGQLDGWGQAMWAFGAHFAMTRDMAFARRVYPYMERAVNWLHKVRAGDEYHLMPPTGPYDNEAISGRYTGHEFWALLGLRGAVDIAKALGKSDGAARFQAEYDDLYDAFMKRLGAVTAKTGGYIPPGLDVEGGQDWDNLIGVYPSGVLPPDHPWITATWKKMRAEKFTEGVMSYRGATHSYLTENVTETSIIRGEQQDVISDLYGMLLHTDSTHASYEWGIWEYSNRDFGGNFSPHAWGHMKYVAALRNMLVREEGDDLHLLSVVSPQWVGEGKRITVTGAPTDFGFVDYVLDTRQDGAHLTISTQLRSQPKQIVVHVPWFAKVTRAESAGREVTVMDGRIVLPPTAKDLTLTWRLSKPDRSFNNTVEQYEREYAKRYETYLLDGGKPMDLAPDPLQTLAERAAIFDRQYKDVGIAVSKPVTATGKTEGHNIPELAVDGVHDDTDSGWWAHPTPVSLTVDLEAPTRVGGVQVYFYWGDERYYQYKVDVSSDGRKWTSVVDASANTTLSNASGYRHEFEPVTARYIRLTVLKNSANYASHVVELKVLASEE
jgi:hypothetical protein